MDIGKDKAVSADQCFYKIKIKPTCRAEILDFAQNIKDWDLDKSPFLRKSIPLELFKDDPLLQNIFDVLETKLEPAILKLTPNVFYRMHIDAYRGAAVNMLLNETTNSVSYFNCGEFREMQNHVEVLNYEMDTYYLFNTQIEHAILNLESDRYLLTTFLGRGKWNRKPDDINFYAEYKNKLIAAGF